MFVDTGQTQIMAVNQPVTNPEFFTQLLNALAVMGITSIHRVMFYNQNGILWRMVGKRANRLFNKNLYRFIGRVVDHLAIIMHLQSK